MSENGQNLIRGVLGAAGWDPQSIEAVSTLYCHNQSSGRLITGSSAVQNALTTLANADLPGADESPSHHDLPTIAQHRRLRTRKLIVGLIPILVRYFNSTRPRPDRGMLPAISCVASTHHHFPEGKASTHNDFFSELLTTYSETAFHAKLRLSRAAFLTLFELVKAAPSYNRQRKTSLDQRIWLAAVLYQLGHGVTISEASDVFGVSKTQYCDWRPMILDCIIEALSNYPDYQICWPTTDEGWNALADTFGPSIFSRFPAFAGVVAAGDGTLIPVDPYGLSDAKREVWRCRKGFVAQNCLVFFDGKQRIVHAEVMYEGSTSDQELLNTLMINLAPKMPQQSFILFDSGEQGVSLVLSVSLSSLPISPKGGTLSDKILTPFTGGIRYHLKYV